MMAKIRSMLTDQSNVGEPERRGNERSEAPRSGGSSTFERVAAPAPPDPEVPARHARRRFTTAYKLEILRKADACTRHGELGALLRTEGLYSSHLITWRQQRERGLTPKKRGRKAVAVHAEMKKLCCPPCSNVEIWTGGRGGRRAAHADPRRFFWVSSASRLR